MMQDAFSFSETELWGLQQQEPEQEQKQEQYPPVQISDGRDKQKNTKTLPTSFQFVLSWRGAPRPRLTLGGIIQY